MGQTPELKVPESLFRVNQLSRTTNEGKVRFLTYTRTLTAALFVEFLGRLLRGTRRKIILILDRNPVHEAAAVAKWVAGQGGRM